jgi:hypothetical protein
MAFRAASDIRIGICIECSALPPDIGARVRRVNGKHPWGGGGMEGR